MSSNVHRKTQSTNTTLSLKSGSNCTLITYNILNANDKSTHGLFTIATTSNPPTWFAGVGVYSCPKGFMIMNVQCNITTTSVT